VSDSWTIPSKWKRIVIAAAGIYVELIIASFATFIWWWTESGTFINNLCMSLIIVCSISTIIFNANPLMRFDGYYILSDWLEIPNLRERSNRFLKTQFMQHCLGMEVQPEPYMTRSRQILFISYAVGSWLYRWVVTFGVLYFMYTFLEPYKLGSISYILGTGAVASMFGYPIYNLIKAYRRRGRIPDMSRWRVGITVGVTVALVVLVLTVPFPVKVKGLAVIQVNPEHVRKVAAPEAGGFLTELKVIDGQRVRKGDIIALLVNPELETQLKLAQRQAQARDEQASELKVGVSSGALREDTAIEQINHALSLRDNLRKRVEDLKAQSESLTLRAPQDGVVMKLVSKDEINRKQDPGTLICEIGESEHGPGESSHLRALLLVEPSDRSLVDENLVVEGESKAVIRVHGLGWNEWPGTVDHVAVHDAKDIPPQLSYKAGGDVVTEQDPESKVERPQQQHYVISVRFDDVDPAMHAGVLARVKISAKPRTLGWRLWRYLRTTFNIGL
jgi:putative peptide zinc metalloprotease protein